MGERIKLRMFVRASIVWGCLFVLSGCAPDEPVPQIIYDYTPNNAVSLPPAQSFKTPKSVRRNVPRDWLPPSPLEKEWTAIVVHHSDTSNGSATIFDKYHKSRYWEGIGYDFVIGNGTDSGDGQVEVTFRWREQRTGAHCKTPNNWANEDAVGICLVGNFDEGLPTSRQMRSLVKLVRFLQSRYRIPRSRVYGHKDTPGAGVTECPGNNFPMARLKSMLSF